MKYRNACFLIVSIMLLFVSSVPVQAQEIPFEIKLEYTDSRNQVLVSVVASEPVVLEAFTFSIMFDNTVYKLHKGYDKLQNGYGYSQEFTEHQGNAMMLSNALEDKVIFSGVNDSKENDTYEGVIAQTALLKYSDSQSEETAIWLDISALHINGGNINLTDDNKQVFYEGNVEFEKENELLTESDVISSQYPQLPVDTEPNEPQISEPGKAEIKQTEVSKIEISKTENIKNQGTVSPQSVSYEAVSATNVKISETEKTLETKNTTDSEKEQRLNFMPTELFGIIIVLLVCVVSGSIVLIYKKRKRRD